MAANVSDVAMLADAARTTDARVRDRAYHGQTALTHECVSERKISRQRGCRYKWQARKESGTGEEPLKAKARAIYNAYSECTGLLCINFEPLYARIIQFIQSIPFVRSIAHRISELARMNPAFLPKLALAY